MGIFHKRSPEALARNALAAGLQCRTALALVDRACYLALSMELFCATCSTGVFALSCARQQRKRVFTSETAAVRLGHHGLCVFFRRERLQNGVLQFRRMAGYRASARPVFGGSRAKKRSMAAAYAERDTRGRKRCFSFTRLLGLEILLGTPYWRYF